MTDLKNLVELSTDGIDSPHLTSTAIAGARRRRTRRRGAVGAATASVAIAGAITVPQFADRSSTEPTTEQSPLTRDTSPSPTAVPGGPLVQEVAPPIAEDVIQPRWDPTTVVDLPTYPIRDLPQTLDPLADPSAVVGGLPLALTVADDVLLALNRSGWVPIERPDEVGDIGSSALSRDGRRAVVVTDEALWWFSTTAADPGWTRVEVPNSVRGDGVRIVWTWDAARVYLAGFNRAYLVDLDSEEVSEQPHLRGYADFDVVPGDGHVVARQLEPRSLAEWDGPEQATPSATTGELGGLNHLAVFDGAIAATRIDLAYGDPRNPSDGDGIVTLNRGDLETTAFLPFTGASGQWVDGDQVRPLQWLNKITVLLSVRLDDTQAGEAGRVYLVAWNTFTGDKGLVGSYDGSVDLSLRSLYPS